MNISTAGIVTHETGLPPGSSGTLEESDSFLIGPDERILITGATGFIGSRVLECLLDRGFRNLVCMVRPARDASGIEAIAERASPSAKIEVLKGNLLSRQDCEAACKDVAVILHLAAGTGEKSFPNAFMNSVVTTRNLLDASLQYARLRRFVLVSSFAVYTNRDKPRGRLLDESCPLEVRPEMRGDAYCFAKVKQEELVCEYGKNRGIPYVIVRPGNVYGAGKEEIVGRIGIGSFGVFLHLGGSNPIPFTYVDNCAEAIALAGLVRGVDGEAFNVVDDDLPSSRQFLRQYKKNVKGFTSLYMPHAVSHALSFLWDRYSRWSRGQLPPVFNPSRWHATWKKTRYSNQKLKSRLGWTPKVSTTEGMRRYFQSYRQDGRNA
jgi:nucleoside-diphosphate-sugar epimerase